MVTGRRLRRKELEDTYLRVSNQTIRALQAELAATNVEPDEDPDTHIMKVNRLRRMLSAVKEPGIDRHFMDIIVQGLVYPKIAGI